MDFKSVIDATFELSTILDRLGVEHFIGGSIPSIIHGEPRSTNDVDIVAALKTEHIALLQLELGDDYYHDAEMMHDALERTSSFNIMRLNPFLKFDIFVLRHSPDALQEMQRRKRYLLWEDPPRKLPLATPEDTILQKLRWFRLGNGVSDQQWRDIKGVIKVKAPVLDAEYLNEWAKKLELEELLAKAMIDALE